MVGHFVDFVLGVVRIESVVVVVVRGLPVFVFVVGIGSVAAVVFVGYNLVGSQHFDWQ